MKKIICKFVLLLFLFPLSGCTLPDGNQVDTTKHEENYTILYSDENKSDTLIVSYGQMYVIDYIPQKSGYKFIGWFDSEEGGTKYCSSTGESFTKYKDTKDIKLYAQFETVEYSLILDYGESSITGKREYSVVYGSKIEELPLGSEVEHRTFIGWFTKPNGEGIQLSDELGLLPLKSDFTNKIFVINHDNLSSTIYAHYETEKLTVTFHYNDEEYVKKQVYYGTEFKNVAPKYYDKKIIDSWSTTKNDKSLENVFNDVVITEDINLYITNLTDVKIKSFNSRYRTGQEKIHSTHSATNTIYLPYSTKATDDAYNIFVLSGLGYKECKFTFSFDVCEVDNSYQYIEALTGYRKLINVNVNHGGRSKDKNWKTYTYTVSIPLDEIDSTISVKFFAENKWFKDWYIGTCMVTVTPI